jgi:hypothetical protein
MEKIIKIEEISFIAECSHSWGRGLVEFDGVIVTTDKHVYRAGISNDQQCCESWSYILNEDKDAPSFVGAILLEVESDGTFTNFKTNRGTLNFTAYNDHNGYYSHDCILQKDDVIIQRDVL